MFKKILIISDNIILCERFERIIDSHLYAGFNWVFSVSPYSKLDNFKARLKNVVVVYDLKNDKTVDELISSFDLVFSLHCKQIFPSKLVNNVKCINVHPGYNPINRGWYPQVFAIINGLPVGATIHEIDEKLDHGKIIAREFVDQEIYDTSQTLYTKIIAKEIELLERYLPDILYSRSITAEPENEGNLFLKKDFNALLKFDLSEKMTGLEFINKLRALTHGENKNAYFMDSKTGKKIFITIKLDLDKT